MKMYVKIVKVHIIVVAWYQMILFKEIRPNICNSQHPHPSKNQNYLSCDRTSNYLQVYISYVTYIQNV